MKYNDEEYFELGRDCKVAFFKKRKKDWTSPNHTKRCDNTRHATRLKRTVESDSNTKNRWSLVDARRACGIICM
jgi:hypothetical protein